LTIGKIVDPLYIVQDKFSWVFYFTANRLLYNRTASVFVHFVEIVHTWANHPPSQPMIATQLLGQPAKIEQYTINNEKTPLQIKLPDLFLLKHLLFEAKKNYIEPNSAVMADVV
jgi:hypothetical protein